MPKFIYAFIIIATILCIGLPMHTTKAASAGDVSVNGTEILVSSTIGIVGDLSVLDQWNEAVKNFYHTTQFLYKCYNLNFDIDVKDQSELSGDDYYDVQVIDVTSDPAVAEAYRRYGMYTNNDWELYIRETGNNIGTDCSYFWGYQYDVRCAEWSQWFWDNGYRRGKSLGYALTGGARYDGSMLAGYGALPNNASDQTIAHEIGHMLGFLHTDGDEFLMDPTTGASKNNLNYDNLQEMLKYMNLDCRWTMELNNMDLKAVTTDSCPAPGCGGSVLAAADSEFQVESIGNTLIGTGGTINYSDVQYNLTRNDANCTTTVNPVDGRFDTNGNITGLTEEQISQYSTQAFILDIKTSYTEYPKENAILIGPHAYAQIPVGLLEGYLDHGGFYHFQVVLGEGANPKQILNDVNFGSEFSHTSDCIYRADKLTMDNLIITAIEPLQRAQSDFDFLIK